jgi:hypothetical protein
VDDGDGNAECRRYAIPSRKTKYHRERMLEKIWISLNACLHRIPMRKFPGLHLCLILTGLLRPVCSCAEDGVQRKVLNLDRDKDGKPDLIVETFTRKSKVVLRSIKRLEKGGFWSQTRSLHVADQQIVIEEDSDGDGIFQLMVVLNPKVDALESFSRSRDGTLSIAPPGTNERFLKAFAALNEFWKAAPETKETDLPDLIRKTQRDLREKR